MKITIIGAGYVGLVTAAVFADFGNIVYCVDIVAEKIESLKKGKIPFFEPALADYVQRNLAQKRLFFTTKYSEAIPKSQVVFVCVGTPPQGNGEADLSYLFRAIEQTSKHIKDYILIVIKSTVPPGLESELEKIVKSHTKSKFEFAACPEFLREGTAIEDSLNPARIVIGTQSPKAQELLLALHAPIPGKRVLCDLRSAQVIKYAANAFLATKVSFANAIATLCEKMGADVEKVLMGVGFDERIGSSFLSPGIGYGGSCLPKDVLAFIAIASHFGYNFELLRAVDDINLQQIENFTSKIKSVLNTDNLAGYKIAVLGLAFKPNTDDIRDAPSIKVINHLLNSGAKITAFDPQAIENTKKVLPDINYATDVYTAIEDKDAMLILTEWPQFQELDLTKVKKLLKKPVIVDGRNIYDSQKLKKLGFKYIGVGR